MNGKLNLITVEVLYETFTFDGWGSQIRKKTFDDVCMPILDKPVHTAQSCVMVMRSHVI